MNFLSAPVMYALLGLSLILGVTAGVQTVRLANEQAAHEKTKTGNAQVLSQLADLSAKASEAVRARETKVRDMLDASNQFREQGIANAVESQQVLVADLRDGTRKLRQQWAGCQAGNGVSNDPGAKPGVDGAADLRAEDTGNLVGIGDTADINTAGLQAYARACQSLAQPVNP